MASINKEDNMTKVQNYIALESEVLMGDATRTYFVDLVSVMPDGRESHGNLRSFRNVTKAREFAREQAITCDCHVQDETLETRPYELGTTVA